MNEEISGNENQKEMKILKKYNSVLEENMRLKEELIKFRNDNNNLAFCFKDVEGIDKGIGEIIKEMNNSKQKNAKLNDKVEKNDLEIKIRDKIIEYLKEQINNYIQNIKSLIKEKNDYIGKKAILSGQLSEYKNEKKTWKNIIKIKYY